MLILVKVVFQFWQFSSVSGEAWAIANREWLTAVTGCYTEKPTTLWASRHLRLVKDEFCFVLSLSKLNICLTDLFIWFGKGNQRNAQLRRGSRLRRLPLWFGALRNVVKGQICTAHSRVGHSNVVLIWLLTPDASGFCGMHVCPCAWLNGGWTTYRFLCYSTVTTMICVSSVGQSSKTRRKQAIRDSFTRGWSS